jgi:hypothetical protein
MESTTIEDRGIIAEIFAGHEDHGGLDLERHMPVQDARIYRCKCKLTTQVQNDQLNAMGDA